MISTHCTHKNFSPISIYIFAFISIFTTQFSLSLFSYPFTISILSLSLSAMSIFILLLLLLCNYTLIRFHFFPHYTPLLLLRRRQSIAEKRTGKLGMYLGGCGEEKEMWKNISKNTTCLIASGNFLTNWLFCSSHFLQYVCYNLRKIWGTTYCLSESRKAWLGASWLISFRFLNISR